MIHNVTGDQSMHRNTMFAVAALTFLSTGTLLAQPEQKPVPLIAPTVQLSAAEKEFDAIIRELEQRLTDAGSFAVDVKSQWTTQGNETNAKGTNLYRVAVQAGGKLRVEAGSVERGPAQFICVSDSQTITRLLRSRNIYSQHAAAETLGELHHDGFTDKVLTASGVEYLIRPQFRADLIARIRGVEDLGREKAGTAELRHFRLTLIGDDVLDLWFTTDAQPLVARLVVTKKIAIDHQRSFQLVTDGTFTWQVGVKHPEGTFALTLPAEAQRVDDLMATLEGQGVEQLLGKPAPTLELTDLQGTTVNLTQHLGKQVVVLAFWASWCAPSVDKMESLNEFVATCEKAGGAVFFVNLGDQREVVEATIKAEGFKGRVLLDPESASLAAYPVSAIPVTILIGKDGTIQAVEAGVSDEARGRIRAAAAALLTGKSLVPPRS
jgi:peroxiredoxin